MEMIPLAKQDITDREVQAVVDVVHSERLSLGPQIDAFEAACAERANRTYGIAVNSGTRGLHLCVKSTLFRFTRRRM
jgi:perosamine synthetase